MNKKLEFYLWSVFEAGVIVKALNGIWETFIGGLILTASRGTINSVIQFLGRRELFEHPRDSVLIFLQNQFQYHQTEVFVGYYFLIHGLLNLFLAVQLYKNRLWAYLVTISASGIFIIYQLHRIYLYHSRLLILVTIYDAMFIVLTWHEYSYQKKFHMPPSAA